MPPFARSEDQRSRATRILVVDDDPAMTSMLADGLGDHGYDVTVTTEAAQALEAARDVAFDLVITDLRMPGTDGLEILASSKRAAPARPVIVMTAFGAIDTAVESLRRGAYHYLLKPFKLAELELFIERAVADRARRRENETLKRAFVNGYAEGALVAESDAMRDVRDLALRVADATVPVLLVGETGTGKGLLARVIHNESARRAGPFVAINCAALPENLLESELFGHVKGAFTGATTSRDGLFCEADGGTLFLDEIGDMAPALQAKLLHVLERQVVRAVGSSREREVDVRIVAATHRDLRERVKQGFFREDLLYRLEGIAIELPPLRQRRDDIPLLVERFLGEARVKNPRSEVSSVSRELMERLLSYGWPGNVRELEHAMARLVLLGKGPEATVLDLPPTIQVATPAPSRVDFGETIVPVRELTRAYAAWALERVAGRKSVACEKLGIDVKTLNKWLASDDGRD